MKPRVKGIFGCVIFCFTALFPFVADGATISIDSVEVTAGQSFGVGIHLVNNTDLISALTIPLEFNNPHLLVDSVSFVNAILPSGLKSVVDIDNTQKTVQVSYIPSQLTNPLPTINDSLGLLGTIHFTLDLSAAVGIIAVDSLYRDTVFSFAGFDKHKLTQVEFSNQAGTTTYSPGFIPGAVKVIFSTDIQDDWNDGLLPANFELVQNYPNPFNPSTVIEYSLPRGGNVSLIVYNVIGQEVAVLVDGYQSSGTYKITYNAANSPSGVYFYKLVHESGARTRKMMLVK